jgi:excisionase family DNA binding protein
MANPATNLNGNGIRAVPGLDQIAADSRRVAGLNPSVLAAISSKCAAVLAIVAAEQIRISEETGAIERETPQQSDRWLTAKQIAEHLEIKESWVMSEARAKRIPKHMVGRYVRFDLAEVQLALEERERNG